MLSPHADAIPVTGLLAELSLRARFEGWRPICSAVLQPTSMSWTDASLELSDAELDVDGADLVLVVFGSRATAREQFWAHFESELPASVLLDDGTTIDAGLMSSIRSGLHTRRDGSCADGVSARFPYWAWLPVAGEELVIAMTLDGAERPPGRNLVLATNDGAFDATSFRGQGTFDWHLLPGDDKSLLALATFDGLRSSISSVCHDLMALEFVSGSMLDVGVAWVVNRDRVTVGAFALGGVSRKSERARPPVPAATYLRECWAAPLFRLLASKLAESEPVLSIPIAGYLDAQRTHVHGGYLLGQVALEAFCARIAPSTDAPHLVRSPKLWLAWVESKRGEIEEFSDNESDGRSLVNKTLNAFQRPSSSKVLQAFSSWGIELPQELAKEVAGRNIAAHRFVFFDDRSADAARMQRAFDQLACVQSLLVAAIAKYVGYAGPIAGWERDELGNARAADFWESRPIDDATMWFECRAS